MKDQIIENFANELLDNIVVYNISNNWVKDEIIIKWKEKIDTDPEYISQILDYQQGEEPDDCCDSAASLIRQIFYKGLE